MSDIYLLRLVSASARYRLCVFTGVLSIWHSFETRILTADEGSRALRGGLLGVFRTVLVFLLQAAFVKSRKSLSASSGVRYPRAE